MKNDSISASSIIRELIELHKSGLLNDEEYHNLLKSEIISQLKVQPLKVTIEDFSASLTKSKKSKYDLLKSEKINQGEVQPIKEKVEKVLWTLLN